MKVFIKIGLALVSVVLLIAGCKKFYDPVLDQHEYKPDSSGPTTAVNKRHVLVIGIDGLPASELKAIAPTNIVGLLPNAKYSWNVALPVIRTEKDVTTDGVLTVAFENASGAAAANGSSKLVDNNVSSYFSCGPIQPYLPNLWAQQEYRANLPVVEAYTMTSATEAASQNWRDPGTWTLQAANDINGPWVVLDNRSGEIFTARGQTKRFEVSNTTPYRFYRLVVSSIVAINFTGYLQLAEWRLVKYLLSSGGNAGSWAGMITGNDISQHRVFDSSFYPRPVDSSAGTPLSPNLSALRLLYNYKPGAFRTAAISSWGNLVNTLLKDADVKVVTGGDTDTKDQTVRVLKTDSARVIITQFGDVYNKGLQYGFSKTSAPYADAVGRTDGYIGEMLNALKSRPGYTNEEWMVVITTTQGGSGVDRAPIAPGFFVAYNPMFKSQDLSLTNPAVNVLQQDLTPQLLYWMKVPQSAAVQKGQLWLDRFGIEFLK